MVGSMHEKDFQMVRGEPHESSLSRSRQYLGYQVTVYDICFYRKSNGNHCLSKVSQDRSENQEGDTDRYQVGENNRPVEFDDSAADFICR